MEKNFVTVAQERYTTKQYNADKHLSKEQIDNLKEILRLCPSSINSQPWKFIFVSDEVLKNRLAEVSFFNEEKIKQASHLVVFTAIDDLAAFETRITETLPEGSVAYFNRMVKPKGEAAVKSWWHNQVYLSLGYFLSACASLHIDSTPMEGIDMSAYDSILGLQGHKTLFAVAIGYRDENDANQPSVKAKSRLSLNTVVEER